jgi:hypothetical protein
LFDRVLGGHHEKRLFQRIGDPGRGYLVFLHGLEQRGLGFRRGSVDFVGQHDIGKNRPFDETERSLAGYRILVDDLGAGNVAGHEVRGELNPGEFQLQGLRQGGNGQRLGQARHADGQAMPPGKDTNEHLLDHLLLTDDHLMHFVEQKLSGLSNAANRFFRTDLRSCWRLGNRCHNRFPFSFSSLLYLCHQNAPISLP